MPGSVALWGEGGDGLLSQSNDLSVTMQVTNNCDSPPAPISPMRETDAWFTPDVERLGDGLQQECPNSEANCGLPTDLVACCLSLKTQYSNKLHLHLSQS